MFAHSSIGVLQVAGGLEHLQLEAVRALLSGGEGLRIECRHNHLQHGVPALSALLVLQLEVVRSDEIPGSNRGRGRGSGRGRGGEGEDERRYETVWTEEDVSEEQCSEWQLVKCY